MKGLALREGTTLVISQLQYDTVIIRKLVKDTNPPANYSERNPEKSAHLHKV